jgi:hypothetical protein
MSNYGGNGRRRRRNARDTYLRNLRDEGCDCAPQITAIPRWAWPPGMVGGVYVSHDRTCPLGQKVLPMNRAGIIPSLFYRDPGCTRD